MLWVEAEWFIWRTLRGCGWIHAIRKPASDKCRGGGRWGIVGGWRLVNPTVQQKYFVPILHCIGYLSVCRVREQQNDRAKGRNRNYEHITPILLTALASCPILNWYTILMLTYKCLNGPPPPSLQIYISHNPPNVLSGLQAASSSKFPEPSSAQWENMPPAWLNLAYGTASLSSWGQSLDLKLP